MSGALSTLLLAVALTLVATPAPAAPRVATAGTHDFTLVVGGRTRTFVVRVPPEFASRGPLPVLLAFHGGGGNGPGFQAYAGLDRVADREGRRG